jgi:hypothetical protein
MNRIEHTANTLESIAAQHRHLKQQVRTLCRLLCQPMEERRLQEAYSAGLNQLGELRDFLEYHLAQEAFGGYLEDAVARLPRLGTVADEIERQHPLLLAELDALLVSAKTAEPTVARWHELGEAVAAFARRLMEHEAAENRILQQGFNEDPALFE